MPSCGMQPAQAGVACKSKACCVTSLCPVAAAAALSQTAVEIKKREAGFTLPTSSTAAQAAALPSDNCRVVSCQHETLRQL